MSVRALALIFAIVKGVFMVGLVTVLAAAEPFWHQAILVLGSALITAAAVVLSAYIGTRKVEEHVEDTHRIVSEIQQTQSKEENA